MVVTMVSQMSESHSLGLVKYLVIIVTSYYCYNFGTSSLMICARIFQDLSWGGMTHTSVYKMVSRIPLICLTQVTLLIATDFFLQLINNNTR